MNCCWILLLLLFGGRDCGCNCNMMGSRAADNGCGCGGREDRGGRQRGHGGRREREERREERSDCGCAEAREGSRDVASTIPQPWQEYAKRDEDSCQD